MSNQPRIDLHVVFVDRCRAIPAPMHLLYTLEILSRAHVLPYQAERAKASRKRILDAHREQPFNSLEATPLALRAAVEDEIADKVRKQTDRFVSERAHSIAPTRTGFNPVRRHRDTVHFKPNRFGMNDASDISRASDAATAVAQSLSK